MSARGVDAMRTNSAKDRQQFRSGYLSGATLMSMLSGVVINNGFSKWWIPGATVALYVVAGLLWLGRREAERGR
jgi:hypothetical protein